MRSRDGNGRGVPPTGASGNARQHAEPPVPGDGPMTAGKGPDSASAYPVPSESEIADAAGRLSAKWAQAAAAQRASAAPGQVVQSLSPGRSRSVTVEVRRRPKGPRS